MQDKTPKKLRLKRGRNRRNESELSPNKLTALRMQKMRRRKKQKNFVPVDIWIPKSQREALKAVLQKGEDLSAAAIEAFAFLIKRRKGK
jgi:hypothetical protein